MVPETNMPVRFYLSPNREDGSASILVSEPLDYETTPFFSLRVRAQNVAAVPLAAFTRVYINITGIFLLFFDCRFVVSLILSWEVSVVTKAYKYSYFCYI